MVVTALPVSLKVKCLGDSLSSCGFVSDCSCEMHRLKEEKVPLSSICMY